MIKEIIKPIPLVFPVPAVMISCGIFPDKINIITIAWTGIVCSNPPTCFISVRPERYSHSLILENKEFVINYANADLLSQMDLCGVKSGRNCDKFKEAKLTPTASKIVKSPMIAESPISVECIVKSIHQLGSHDMFVAEIVSISIDTQIIDPLTYNFNLSDTHPIAYAQGSYYELGSAIGKYGFTSK